VVREAIVVAAESFEATPVASAPARPVESRERAPVTWRPHVARDHAALRSDPSSPEDH
jgi:hypothetical protein